jgi:hypothetical protein
MRLFELIEERKPKRVLEFGHGFNVSLFEYCEDRGIEIWGVDDHMDLPYFPAKEIWHRNHKEMLRDRFLKANFVLGQLGSNGGSTASIPTGYFDLVCSVSVLEEIGDKAIIVSILEHANMLLKQEGVLANTHDIVFEDPIRPALLIDCLTEAGFDAKLIERETEILGGSSRYVPWNKALLENPTQAMVCYNVGDVDRIYSGHWTTLFSSVRKVQSAGLLKRLGDFAAHAILSIGMKRNEPGK